MCDRCVIETDACLLIRVLLAGPEGSGFEDYTSNANVNYWRERAAAVLLVSRCCVNEFCNPITFVLLLQESGKQSQPVVAELFAAAEAFVAHRKKEAHDPHATSDLDEIVATQVCSRCVRLPVIVVESGNVFCSVC